MSNNSPPPNRWSSLALLIVAVLGPPSAVLAFTRTATQNPWLIVILITIYELLVFVITFFSKVWQRLEEPWTEKIADRVNNQVDEWHSNDRQQYFQRLLYQHRNFENKGFTTQNAFTPQLEQVFVDLQLESTTIRRASRNIVNAFIPLQIDSHSIWEYLASPFLATQHFVILGPPGSGKTTLLKHIALILIQQTEDQSSPGIPFKLPILLLLREQVEAFKEQPNHSLMDAIQKQMELSEKSSRWILHELTKGRGLILLDGLDEVPDVDMRRRMVSWIEQQMINYGKNRFIITSRPLGYRSNPLNGVATLQVQPFLPEQIERFLHNWYVVNEIMSTQQDDIGTRTKAVKNANDLFQRMQNTLALLNLATNPLLLTMIATVHRYRSSLPGKRIDLYAEVCEYLLSKRQESKGITQMLTSKQKIHVLQDLAYYMMHHGKREIKQTDACQVIEPSLTMVSPQTTSETFLSSVEETSGLLVEQESGIYSFAHLTFQEYLTALYLFENKQIKLLINYIGLEWWNETIRLYCALTDATPILQACLTRKPLSAIQLALALECRDEAFAVQPAVGEQLDRFLEQAIESDDPDLRKIASGALLARRIQ